MKLGVQRLKAGVDLAVCSLVRETGENLHLSFDKDTQAAAAQLVLDKILRSAQDLGRPSEKLNDSSSVLRTRDPAHF
jgi:hypothetical protein